MSLHVSIDFGTSSTCTVASVGGAEPRVVVIDGQPLMPSAVFAAPEGTLFVGHEAERQAAVDPARFEPHPKRRIDEGELLLGADVFGVADVLRAVLVRGVAEARRHAAGAVVDLLVLTHPADWGAVRAEVLRRAATGLAREVVLVAEPVAAAVFHSAGHGMPDEGALAVLDLGGGTVDASVVRKQGGAFRVLATRGDPHFGGADIDQLLLDHVGTLVGTADPAEWAKLVSGRDIADRRRRRVVSQDVRGAKESLSRHTYTDVPLPPPFADAHVTRGDLESLVLEPLSRAVRLVTDILRDAAVQREQLSGVFLVGGSSRIPLVGRLLHDRAGALPTTLDQPETVVARGALRAVRLDPARSGGLAPSGGWSGPHDVAHSASSGFYAGAEQSGANPPQGPVSPRTWTPPRFPAGASFDQSTAGPRPAGSPTSAAQPLGPRPPRPGVAGSGSPGLGATDGEGGSAAASDSLSDARTIVIGGADQTRPVSPASRPHGPQARRARGGVLLGLGAVTVTLAVALTGVLVARGTDHAAERNELAQYGYAFEQPRRWERTAEDSAAREVTLRPAEAGGADRIAVRERRVAYDATSEGTRAVRDVRADYDARAAAGARLSQFTAPASFSGRDVVYFHERRRAASVEWYVLHRGGRRLSVACQYRDGDQDAEQRACERVVGSLHTR